RYPIRVRYPREVRDNIDAMQRILVPGSAGEQVPLSELASVTYTRGRQEIKSEDNFLVAYVLFDKLPGYSEVDVIEDAARVLQRDMARGTLVMPPRVHYKFAGTYENQIHFSERLRLILPLSCLLLFLLLYFEFRSVTTSL